jgi:biotin carboxyl carrier protein
VQHEYVLRAPRPAGLSRTFTLDPKGLVAVDPSSPAQPLKVLRRDASGLVTVLWGQTIVTGILRAGSSDSIDVTVNGQAHSLILREAAVDAMEQKLGGSGAGGGKLEITSPIPGLVKAVNVKVGDEVKLDQTLIVLEAMKMENEITAPHDGKVSAIAAVPGQAVAAGAPLITIEP